MSGLEFNFQPTFYSPEGSLSAISSRQLNVSPSATKLPSPIAWIMRRSWQSGLTVTRVTFIIIKPYFSMQSTTLHSRQAMHLSIKEAFTVTAGSGVGPNILNLSIDITYAYYCFKHGDWRNANNAFTCIHDGMARKE